jgi:hypothetical protein
VRRANTRRAMTRVVGAPFGGFSGNESQVTAQWLAAPVKAGRIRYVLTTAQSGFNDGRTGSRDVMSAVEQACAAVNAVDGLYDCHGHEAALAGSGG